MSTVCSRFQASTMLFAVNDVAPQFEWCTTTMFSIPKRSGDGTTEGSIHSPPAHDNRERTVERHGSQPGRARYLSGAHSIQPLRYGPQSSAALGS